MTPDIDGASIAVRGSFNPGIFHPNWFRSNNLIRADEAENAKLKVTHPEFSSFSAGQFELEVTRDTFVLRTTDSAHFFPIRDLVYGTFSILKHTPVSFVGLNRMMHVQMPSEDTWHSFGDLIAPKDIWKGVMKDPGLISLTIQDPKKDPDKYMRVRIEPSERLELGVYVEVNNHYHVKEEKTEALLSILKDYWEHDMKNSTKIAEHLLKQHV